MVPTYVPPPTYDGAAGVVEGRCAGAEDPGNVSIPIWARAHAGRAEAEAGPGVCGVTGWPGAPGSGAKPP